MANAIQVPFPVFLDEDGSPLDDGYVDIGVAGLNPLSNPLQAYWDQALTIPASGIRTSGGYAMYGGAPGRIYVSGDYSILVRDKNGKTVLSRQNCTVDYPDLFYTYPRGTLTRSARTPNSYDFNAIREGGPYAWTNGSTVNYPSGCAPADLFMLEVFASPDGSGIIIQHLRDMTNGPESSGYEYVRQSVDAGATWTTWKSNASRAGRPVGEVFEMAIEATVSESFPAVALWDSDHDISASGAGSYPLLVPALRAQKLKAWSGAAYVTDHTVTIAGSVATGSGTAWDNMLAMLAEEVLVHGSYTNWRCINIAGTDYAITNVNAAAHTVTVSGSPTTGSQTAIVYPYRIAGSSTTARLFKDSGRATMTPDGQTYAGGLRRRDRMQGHKSQGNLTSDALGGDKNIYKDYILGGATTQNTLAPVATAPGSDGLLHQGSTITSTGNPYYVAAATVTDGTNGTPRTGATTDPAASIVFRYMWAGTYSA